MHRVFDRRGESVIPAIRSGFILMMISAIGSIAPPASAETGTTPVQILSADWYGDRILRIDAQTGQSSVLVVARAGGLDSPAGMAFAPDGSLLVGSFWNDRILRYNAQTGESLGVFATGVDEPWGIRVGPDGDVYVASRGGNGVYRFDGSTGQAKGLFATTDSSALWWAFDLQFRPGNDMLLTSFERGRILRFNAQSGAFLGDLGAANTGYAGGLALGPEGDVFVTRYFANTIERIDGLTGNSEGVFASGNGMNHPVNMAFAPDGKLYVANQDAQVISVFDAASGTSLGTIPIPVDINGGSNFLMVVPEPGFMVVLWIAPIVLTSRWWNRLRLE